MTSRRIPRKDFSINYNLNFSHRQILRWIELKCWETRFPVRRGWDGRREGRWSNGYKIKLKHPFVLSSFAFIASQHKRNWNWRKKALVAFIRWVDRAGGRLPCAGRCTGRPPQTHLFWCFSWNNTWWERGWVKPPVFFNFRLPTINWLYCWMLR